MNNPSLPTFAIIGHPNEGKSSVVSTLTENDRVRISPTPGETLHNEWISLKLNGKPIVQFVDTPGFQNPLRALKWFQENADTEPRLIEAFSRQFATDPDFDHDRELLKPLQEGAGALFVVDGSRPLTKTDLAEMEILRLIGCPRMALINAKSDSHDQMEQWKVAFRKSFNAVRVFDACNADFIMRVELLEALKSIEQDWSPQLQTAIDLILQDRDQKRRLAADALFEMIEKSLLLSKSRLLPHEGDLGSVKSNLEQGYKEDVRAIEDRGWHRILQIFHHTKLSVSLPEQSILNADLFSEQTWQALGLTRKQLAIAGGGLGAGIGAGLDVAFGGIAFGVFTATAAAAGAGAAFFKGRELARMKVKRIPLGGYKVSIGPNQNDQFPFVLLDRCFLLYRYISNRAHAKQDTLLDLSQNAIKSGVSSHWESDQRALCGRTFKAMKNRKPEALETLREPFIQLLLATFKELEGSKRLEPGDDPKKSETTDQPEP